MQLILGCVKYYVYVYPHLKQIVPNLSLSVENVSQLTELSYDRMLRTEFIECLSGFSLHAAAEYARLSDETLSVLLPFSTTYLREAGFSAMTAKKD
jgi:hypothetical protein